MYDTATAHRLNEITEMIGQWANKTFAPDGDYRGPSIVAHLRKEVEELAADPTNMKEVADCMILLMHLAYQNFQHHEGDPIRNAVLCKFEELLTRKWGEPDENGVIEHIRDN